MLVRVLEPCIYGDQRKRVGDEFDYQLAEGQKQLPACVVAIKSTTPKEKPEQDKPLALSEISKASQQAQSFVESVRKNK